MSMTMAVCLVRTSILGRCSACAMNSPPPHSRQSRPKVKNVTKVTNVSDMSLAATTRTTVPSMTIIQIYEWVDVIASRPAKLLKRI
jgi:hypothetical protein